jgi:hypothetical protein
MLITIGVSLYIPELNKKEKAVAYALSSVAMVINTALIIAFIFFIWRGVMRRFFPYRWAKISSCWKRTAPEKIKKVCQVPLFNFG